MKPPPTPRSPYAGIIAVWCSRFGDKYLPRHNWRRVAETIGVAPGSLPHSEAFVAVARQCDGIVFGPATCYFIPQKHAHKMAAFAHVSNIDGYVRIACATVVNNGLLRVSLRGVQSQRYLSQLKKIADTLADSLEFEDQRLHDRELRSLKEKVKRIHRNIEKGEQCHDVLGEARVAMQRIQKALKAYAARRVRSRRVKRKETPNQCPPQPQDQAPPTSQSPSPSPP